MDTWWFVVSIVGYLISLALIPRVLLTRKKQPGSTVAWIFAIFMFPIVGAALFLIFGINRVKRRVRQKQQATRSIGPSLQALSHHYLLPDEVLDPHQRQIMRLASRLSSFRPTSGNRVELMPDTRETFRSIEEAILAAERTIHVEYYIYRSDRAGTRMRDLLIRKAREGVKVRFLYDSIGSLFLSNRFLKPMKDAGIQVATFLPGRTFRERWSINLCNHRKIVLTDGRVGFTGGVNIGDEYLGRNPNYGYWRDTHLRLQGPAVLQLQQVFAEDWYYATKEELSTRDVFPEPEEVGDVPAQVLAGSPQGDVDVFHALMFGAINEARDHVTLASSYFVPPPALLSALETAALRGVKVRIMTAGPPTYWWTLLAGRSYYDALLPAGAEIYEYGRGLFHCKTLTVDDGYSLVGTPNFDARSVFLNFEVAVLSYDRRSAELLRGHFDDDLKWCRRIEPEQWRNRSRWEILAENTCRLFSPVL